MATLSSVTPVAPHELQINFAYQQLKTHAWNKFHYKLTLNDIEELIYSDIWNSLDEFIEYITQDGINISAPATAHLFSNDELDAMSAEILPLNYGNEQIDISGGQAVLQRRDFDNESIFTNYTVDTLPLYDGIKLPPYESNEALYSPPEYTEIPLPASIPSPKISTKTGHFSNLRPRISAKVNSLKEKLRFPRNQESNISEEPAEERAHGVRKLARKVGRLSPKRIIRDIIASHG
ncbi:hypothetical protein F5Y08DRAFT_346041 [Xylaria arbuscula]|nr:hypothetical protein F5Y08DRAFT_346041 [Xylaria arbuscula]